MKSLFLVFLLSFGSISFAAPSADPIEQCFKTIKMVTELHNLTNLGPSGCEALSDACTLDRLADSDGEIIGFAGVSFEKNNACVIELDLSKVAN